MRKAPDNQKHLFLTQIQSPLEKEKMLPARVCPGLKYLVGIFLFLFATTCQASIDLDRWANAIFKAEGGYKATYLYGIRSISYKDEAEARRICKNTVYNTLVKYRENRCRAGESDIDCMARRYCPINADNDPKGLNKTWKKNVLYYMDKEGGGSYEDSI